jgi:dihydrofolate reductase
MTRLSLIAAMARNRVIGRDNTLPWHLPEDLRHFKATTLGKPVIMGRKTWESLGRPLPGRRNIVVSRNANYMPTGGERADSLENAIAVCSGVEEAFVIGGAELYRQALPLAGRIYLTEIALEVEGDASFPEISAAEWEERSREAHISAEGLGYAFVVFERR